ncbi:hypothetical protein [Alteromonas confluentis]|uniref:Uncharacterized protein n=1 Tax=Alteromonas confluentis TaxID=1656094 RepID=A0A1E7ZE68_9ALTE|nr:hypothetical protein [Alteromonas confluentis]OFC71797.1 hypothetical protein BFC18_06485 [Alteromonas confluentis]
MRKLLLVAGLLALTGCSTKTGLVPTEHHSGFDDARIVNIAPHANACKSISCTGFGLQWSSKYPDSALITVQLFNQLSAIFGAKLNIDGDIITLKENQITTSSDISQDGFIKNSSKAFIISMENLQRITKAKKVWMRVETPDGTLEDAIIDGDTDSKSYYALKRFLAKVG